MVSYNRKLLSPSPAASPYPSSDGLSCQLVENCSSDGSVSCFECFPSYLPSPQPQPPVRQNSLQNHIVPYLITIVCVLGVAFLILSTCTVLLRHRWNRRRRNSRRVTDFTSPDDGFYDGHDGPGSIDHPIWHITTIGLQQSVIDSITAFKYHKYQGLSIDGGDCSVCLTEFEDGDDLRLLPKCSHAFHMPCIDTWLRSHTNCPLCRAPIVDEVSGGGSCGGTSSSTDSVSHEVGPQSQRMEDVHSNSGSSDHRRGRSGRHSGESSFQIRHRGVDFGVLPVEGITMDEILKKQREHLRVCSDFAGLQMEGMKMDEVLKKQSEDLRVRSDLGDIHYRAWMGEDFEPIRRSLSFDLSLDLRSMKGEGTSSSKQGKGVDSGKDAAGKQQLQLQDDDDDGRNESISFESMKNPSIERLLQKGPVSMRRSISSSSGKFFSSFRKSKSQATVLPL